MTEVWSRKYGRVIQWNGDPQDAPDTCETCDGQGTICKVPFDKVTFWDERGTPPFRLLNNKSAGYRIYSGGEGLIVFVPGEQTLEVEDCPFCGGYGAVYDE